MPVTKTPMTSPTITEENFKSQKLSDWGFKPEQFKLGEDRVDIKLRTGGKIKSDIVWIEAKQKNEDIYKMLSQIIFTAYRAVLSSKDLPIAFGCFNSKVGALIDNYSAQEVFRHPDINWKQTPSNIDDKTVERIKLLLQGRVREYNLQDFGKALQEIERRHSFDKKQITKNNFINVYQEWLTKVGECIEYKDYLQDCYLADLMTDGNKTIAEKLRFVLKQEDGDYYYKKKLPEDLIQEVKIKDQTAYNNFWIKYNRPPLEEYQEFILQRRDLLQPNKARETKGEFFTPTIWANKSKEYIAKAFGDDWQENYYIWDCCCGTGNLEQGLINQDRVFMSTLNQEDLDIMKQLKHMPDATQFQFDFLNDSWLPEKEGGKLPNRLWQILQSNSKKLIIYINPPYLEVTNAKESSGTGKSRDGATTTALKKEMTTSGFGKASNELFLQFYYRIYTQITGVKICSFSTLKNCNAPNFENWRLFFNATFKGGFVCKANTFDNVKGDFPISFQVWDCDNTSKFQYDYTKDSHIKKQLWFDVLNNNAEFEGAKKVHVYKKGELINDWFNNNNNSEEEILCHTRKQGSDFQNQRYIALYNKMPIDKILSHNNNITHSNLIYGLIYVAVRLCIGKTWLNDRDQFTKPFKVGESYDDGLIDDYVDNFKLEAEASVASYSESVNTGNIKYQFETDEVFIGNCIVFALFEKNFTNWQIFPNSEVGLVGIDRDMTVYNLLLKGRVFSSEAQRVLDVAKNIYMLYYGHFHNHHAGWDEARKSAKNAKLNGFTDLWNEFKEAKAQLAETLQQDIYKYGFLRLGW